MVDVLPFQHCHLKLSESYRIDMDAKSRKIFRNDSGMFSIMYSDYKEDKPDGLELIESEAFGGFVLERFKLADTVWDEFYLLHDYQKSLQINSSDKQVALELAEMCR